MDGFVVAKDVEDFGFENFGEDMSSSPLFLLQIGCFNQDNIHIIWNKIPKDYSLYLTQDSKKLGLKKKDWEF